MQMERTADCQEARHLDARQARRLKAEDRYLTRLEKREAEAEALIGELCREGQTVFYINIRSKTCAMTGKIKTGTRGELIRHLLRNNYV